MGLISWIKNKYYDNKLARANKQVTKHNVSKAEELFISLLGKQPQAVVDLASLYVRCAGDVQSQIDTLRKIVALKEYVIENNSVGYNAVLSGFVNQMHINAQAEFSKEKYYEAVLLIDALVPHISSVSFTQQVAQYHAYYSFSQSLLVSDYEQKLSGAVRYLKQYESDCLNDIETFVARYKEKQRYVRAITLLTPFINTYPQLKNEAIVLIVGVVEGKDFDKANYTKLSEFISDLGLMQDAAAELIRLSDDVASHKDYKTAILYDDFAAEFYGNDNNFNNNRCLHIADDIIIRTATSEVKSLLLLAKQLKLTSKQIEQLKNKIKAMLDAVVAKHDVYIQTAAHISNFKSALIAIDDNEYLLTTSYQLFRNGCTLIRPFLVQQKKQFIHKLVQSQNFERAEAEAKSLIGIDEEAETLIAEIYYAKSLQTENADDVLRIYYDLVSLIDTGKILPSFNDKKDKILSTLTQLSKAEYEQGHTEQAYAILEVISHQPNYWLELYITLRTNDNKQLKTLIRQIQHAEESIQVITEKVADINAYETQCLNDFWVYYKTLIQKKVQSQPKEKAIDNLKQLREKLEKYLHSTLNTPHIAEITQQLVKLEWSLACECEAEQEYDKAITLYENIKAENVAAYSGRSELRLLICYVKADKMDESLRNRAKEALATIKSHEKLKEDLAYRLGLHLLKLLRADEAEHLFTTYLGEQNTDLIKLCQIVRIQWAESEVVDFKQHLDMAYAGANSNYIDSVIECLQINDKYEKIEKLILTNKQFNSYIPFLKQCSIKSDIENESYAFAVDKILTYQSQYLNDSIQLRNAAMAALGAIENKQDYYDSPKNKIILIDGYENEIIASWSLLDFARINGQPKRATLRNPETGEDFLAIVFPKPQNGKDYTTVYISENLGEISVKEIVNQKNELQIILIKSGEYYLCSTNDNNIYGIINPKYDGHTHLFISICLTAIYTDLLFIKSLEHTSWDDQYTFTLKDSFGGSDIGDYDDIPENINDDAPDDKNVSIRDVQKTLLTRLEVAVRDNYPEYEAFLNEQKSALDALIELKLDQSCTIICPYLASNNREAWNSIKSAFDYELQQNYDNEERVIALGIEYGFTDDIYQKYRDAKDKAEQCKRALNGKLTTIKSAFTRPRLSAIKEYKELFASLKAVVSSDMNNAIQSQTDYKEFIDKYEIICKALNETSLSFAFAQYANGEIVHRLNDETMKLRDGALLLTRIYLVSPSSVQVKENLQGVCLSLEVRSIKEHDVQDKQVINSLLTHSNKDINQIMKEAQEKVQALILLALLKK